jgi:hypothetical protein
VCEQDPAGRPEVVALAQPQLEHVEQRALGHLALAVASAPGAGQRPSLADSVTGTGPRLGSPPELISCARLVLGEPYRYAEHLLPHDGGSRDLSSAEKTRAQLLRDLKLTGVRVLPNDSVATGIEQTRLRLWPHAYFDEEKCRPLLRALESYRAEWNTERKTFALTPRKDWASHGSDAFRYLAMGLRSATLSPRPPMRVPRMVYSFTAPGR